MKSFIEKIENLLEESKLEKIDEITFLSYGYELLVELYDLGYEKESI